MGKLDGTIALVTGGAMGLGRAACLRLTADGAKLAIFDKEPADAVVEAITARGGEADAWRCDVTDESQI